MSEETTLTTTESTDSTEFNFRDHVSDDYKGKYEEFKDIDSLFKSYDNLVGKMGANPITKPSEDATDEQKAEYRAALYKELGAPESADAYELALNEDTPFDEAQLAKAKEVFANANITPDQAQMLMEFEEARYNEAIAARDEKIMADSEALKKEWGADFDKNRTIAQSILKQTIGEDYAEQIGELGNDVNFIKIVHSIASKAMSEESLQASGDQIKTDNPESLRTKARELMQSDAWTNAFDPDHDKVKAEVSSLYTRAATMAG